MSGRAVTSGVVLLVVAAAAACGSASAHPSRLPGPAATFSIRPILCASSMDGPIILAPSKLPRDGPPPCPKGTLLDAATLGVRPDPNTVVGYTMNSHLPSWPQYRRYPPTTPADDRASARVLLPMSAQPADSLQLLGTMGDLVLGPAAVTAADVSSARALFVGGGPRVDIAFTSSGAAALDRLERAQFHALIAVVVDNSVVSAPLVEPSMSGFAPIRGAFEIGGFTTLAQATATAKAISGTK